MLFWYFRTMLWLDIRPSLELRATDTILQQQAPLGKCFLKWGQGLPRSSTTRSVRRASGSLETAISETWRLSNFPTVSFRKPHIRPLPPIGGFWQFYGLGGDTST